MKPSTRSIEFAGDVIRTSDPHEIAAFFGQKLKPVHDDQGKIEGYHFAFPEIRPVDRYIDSKPQIRIRPTGRPAGRAPRIAGNTRRRGSRRSPTRAGDDRGDPGGDSDISDPSRPGRPRRDYKPRLIGEVLADWLEQVRP